ncbi:hypothetical protein DL96DRAFT_602617 [Flagelloscypha sp. PMI_526]|nr:hypothetical protein DL96DRAFT_602617 [Flagelloscypha sp. PMI_526]
MFWKYPRFSSWDVFLLGGGCGTSLDGFLNLFHATMPLTTAAQAIVRHCGLSHFLPSNKGKARTMKQPPLCTSMSSEIKVQRKIIAGPNLLDLLPSELLPLIVSYCDNGTLLACCLTSHRLSYGSQATLYYSILLRTENIRTFTHSESHPIHLVRHLCVSICPVNPIETMSGFAKRCEEGNHDQYWLRQIRKLKKVSQLKLFTLTSTAWTIPLVTSRLESAYFQL